jgi:hypothetical protein
MQPQWGESPIAPQQLLVQVQAVTGNILETAVAASWITGVKQLRGKTGV